MLIDVILEGHAKGWRTFFWEKESSVFEVGLRSDWFIDLRKGPKTYLFFGEMQISDQTVPQWISKLRPYFEMYERRAHPFYVLIKCNGVYNRQRVMVAINELLKDQAKVKRPFLVWQDGMWLNRSGEAQTLLD